MWKIIYLMKKYWTFHIKSLWILLHWYWKQISFETNITSLWKIDFLILLRLHFIFTILLLIWKNRKLRLGVDRWRVELEKMVEPRLWCWSDGCQLIWSPRRCFQPDLDTWTHTWHTDNINSTLRRKKQSRRSIAASDVQQCSIYYIASFRS